MAADANLVLQASTTKTGDFSGTGVTIGNTPRRGMYARVIYTNISCASGSGTIQFQLDVSYDGGSTYQNARFQSPAINQTATAAAGEVHIPFDVSQTDPTKPVIVRLTADFTASSSPSGPTATYSADIVPGRPA